jgi:hypothetical protein
VPLGTVYSRLQVARAAFKREVVRIEAADARAEERIEARPVTRAGGRA